MRKFIVLILILAGCKPEPKAPDDLSKFENSLSGEVYFEGDSLWNIEARMKHYGVPGASIAIIKDNKVVFSKAYGVMDRETNEPVTTATLFQAGSISKPVAAYGALKTVESGKITLTDDINTWLKTWKLPENEFTKEKKVTLERIVSHTAGVTVHGFLGYSPDLPVPTLVQVLDGTAPANSPAIRVDKIPGGDFRYSGGGYTVMQQMLIDVYGKSFPEIEKELVLDPLGMKNSTYDQPLDSVTVKKAATGYLPNGDQTKGKRHTYPEMAAAGLWTTAEDLAKFAIDVQLGLKGESKVLSKEMTEKLLTPINDGPAGLGLFIENHNGSIYFGHGGWDEGFSSDLKASKDKGYGIVVLINANQPDFISEVVRAAAIAYDLENMVTAYKKVAMDTTAFKSIVGRYKNGTDGTITISSEAGKLYFKRLRASERVELFRVSDSTYITQFENAPLQFKGDMLRHTRRTTITHSRMKDDERVPYEYLLAGDFQSALKGYQVLMKADPNDDNVNWDNLDFQAHQQQDFGNDKLAQDLFRINSILHANVKN